MAVSISILTLIVQQGSTNQSSHIMKAFIVLAIFAAAASASLIASPVVGYNSYGLNAGVPLVSGVRTISPVGAAYVAPVATRVVSHGYVAPVSYAAPHYVSAVRPVAARVVHSPIVSGVPVAASVVSPVATRVVSPVVSHVVAPSVYSHYGAGLYGSGYLAKKV